ncbi:lipocalin family protein [Capnocytophaga bilenii]
MRRIFSLALIALAMMVVSCGKKDSDDVTPNKLVGTWYLESIKNDGQAETLTDCVKNTNIVFSDREYVAKRYGLKNTGYCDLVSTEEGTYTVSGNNFVVKPKGEGMESTKVSLSGGKLIFTDTETDNNGKKHTSEMVFVKK